MDVQTYVCERSRIQICVIKLSFLIQICTQMFSSYEKSSCPEWIKFTTENLFVQNMNTTTIYNYYNLLKWKVYTTG